MTSQEMIQLVTEKVKSLIESPTCRPELKDACTEWLNAIGTDRSEGATEKLIAELEDNVRDIDSCIEVLLTPRAVEKFGQEGRDAFLKRARLAKESGAKYCVCDACTLGSEILEMKDQLLS